MCMCVQCASVCDQYCVRSASLYVHCMNRVFGLNLTVYVFFVKTIYFGEKKQIFSKIKRC